MLEKNEVKPEEIDWYILHQANRRILEAVAKRMGEPVEKFPMNMEEYGNTSSASIPILLDEMNRDGRIETRTENRAGRIRGRPDLGRNNY